MNKKMSKRQRDINTKLMAAICMLLVSSIMMVSTTYAWFTLSTAPEVTGITTAVGANGNLEMALLPLGGDLDAITSAAGDRQLSLDARNVTWGNLVDLSYLAGEDNYYGLDKISLYPSKLNITAAATAESNAIMGAAMLLTPAYGADGRVSELEEKTVTSTFDIADKVFPNNTNYGVRAVGTASGMTDRQLAYRNARSAANTAMSQAKLNASQSLNTNGASLANVALAHGVNSNATHTQADVASLQAIVNDLLGIQYEATSSGATHYQMATVVTETNDDGSTTDVTYYSYHTAGDGTPAATHKVVYTGKGVLDQIESAYKNNIIAYAASKASPLASDDEFKVFQSTVSSMTVYEAAAQLGGSAPESLTIPLGKLKTTRANVEEANSGLDALTAEEGITWTAISTPLYKLADADAMKINGYEAETVKDNMSAIINSVASQGLNVVIATGGGVYADVADHCGDFSASIVIKEVSYGNLTLNNMNAKMQTATTVNPAYLSILGTAVTEAGSPDSEDGQTMPISDMYGFIVDLAFRTNAAESNLLLQTAAADRIYDGKGNEDTQGKGSTMTFTSTTTDFTVEQMKELMGAIRVVFFEPKSNSIYAMAKLDMADNSITVVGGNTVTANLYLYEVTAGGSVTEYVEATYVSDGADGYELAGEGETATHAKKADGTYVQATHIADASAEGGYRAITDGETATHAEVITTSTGSETLLNNQTDAVITALTQNTAAAVSALVYLDGEKVGNDDVAATASTSMTGTMNLQFSSSANLIPMEYTPLMNQTGSAATTASTESTDTTETT